MRIIEVLVRAHIADFRQEGRHHLPVIITGIPFNLPDDFRRLQYAVSTLRPKIYDREKRKTPNRAKTNRPRYLSPNYSLN